MWSWIAEQETPNQPLPEIQRVTLAQGASAHTQGVPEPSGDSGHCDWAGSSPGGTRCCSRAAQGEQLSGLAAGLIKLQSTTWPVTQQLWEILIKSIYTLSQWAHV